MAKAKETPKARYFAFLIYPESAPEDWIERLEKIGQPMAISPIHDKDKTERKSYDALRKEAKRKLNAELTIDNLEETEQIKARIYAEIQQRENSLPMYKKAHYHVLYVANNTVTSDSVRRKIQRALGQQAVAHVEIVDNMEGAYLYLTHESKDAIAKHKHVYDKADIKRLNNFDVERYITLDREQKIDILLQIKHIICEFGIPNIIDLELWLEKNGEAYGLNNEQQIMSVVRENVGYIRLYLDGAWQRSQRVVAGGADNETD